VAIVARQQILQLPDRRGGASGWIEPEPMRESLGKAIADWHIRTSVRFLHVQR
jgi:hypothetical protein